jgi:hypothetical protein
MGAETANVHLGGRKAQGRILKDLERLPENWLMKASGKMHRRCLSDWKEFRNS